jgi:hypothetical protein
LGIKKLEAQVGQLLLGCNYLVSRGIFVQEQDTFDDFIEGFFIQNFFQLLLQSLVIFRVDRLALWKPINHEDAVLIPQNRGENFSSGFLHSECFGAG